MKSLVLIAFFFVVFVPAAHTQTEDNMSQRVNLQGEWRFHIGDDRDWSDLNFDDSEWESVFVPATWEDEGFAGYDGFAWYRKHFTLPAYTKGALLYLDLGRIDDVDEVFFNGYFVGSSGRMPENEYETSWNTFRMYLIPPDYLNAGGDNVVAVRVFDERLEGGIQEGNIGLYEADFPYVVNLSGLWQFQIGDNPAWKDRKVDLSGWSDISVPGCWEPQGYSGYDGFAWYRKSFYISERFEGEDLILLLGKIDDVDEAYVNGERIGSTGRTDRFGISDNDSWRRERAYTIPDGVLHFDGNNILTVRVFDQVLNGGIYEGPIGIVKRQEIPENRSMFRFLWEKVKNWFEW